MPLRDAGRNDLRFAAFCHAECSLTLAKMLFLTLVTGFSAFHARVMN